MYAYNPKTGQTIEISQYGFDMLSQKGWVEAEDQTPPPSNNPVHNASLQTPVDMKAIMEAKKAEIAAKKAQGTVTEIVVPPKVEPEVVLPPKVEEVKPKTIKPKTAPGKESGKLKTKK